MYFRVIENTIQRKKIKHKKVVRNDKQEKTKTLKQLNEYKQTNWYTSRTIMMDLLTCVIPGW